MLYIFSFPNTDGLEIGVVIADAYYGYYSSNNIQSDYTTIVVYDLSQVNNACVETNKYAKFMYEAIKDNFKNNDKITFFFNSAQTYECINADLGAIFDELDKREYLSYNASNIREAFNKLVVYNHIGNRYAEDIM